MLCRASHSRIKTYIIIYPFSTKPSPSCWTLHSLALSYLSNLIPTSLICSSYQQNCSLFPFDLRLLSLRLCCWFFCLCSFLQLVCFQISIFPSRAKPNAISTSESSMTTLTSRLLQVCLGLGAIRSFTLLVKKQNKTKKTQTTLFSHLHKAATGAD